jgi:hypothetical protein
MRQMHGAVRPASTFVTMIMSREMAHGTPTMLSMHCTYVYKRIKFLERNTYSIRPKKITTYCNVNLDLSIQLINSSYILI